MFLPRAAALLGLLLLYHEAHAETAPPRVLVVVLPEGATEGDALAGRLVESVTSVGLRAVVEEGMSVRLPDAVEADVTRLEEAARQRELALDLPGALEARREVVTALEGTLEAAVSPARLAAALARVAATEVEGGHRDEAVRLWRRALALDTTLSLDATYSPSAREAFDEAREAGGTLPPRPSRGTLDRLCEAGDLAAILWIAVGADDRGPALVRVLHVPDEPGLGEVRLPWPEEATAREEVLATLARRLEGDLDPLLQGTGGNGDPPPPPPPPPPWYRRWWVWTLVGVAVAGAATATGLVFGLGEERVDFMIHLEPAR